MRTKEQVLQGMDEALFSDICYLDFKFWSERVFGDNIAKDFKLENFHLEWMNIVHTHRFNVLEAARGHAKTTIFSLLYPLWLANFNSGYHLLFTASEESQALSNLGLIKEQIEDNEYLLPLKPKNPDSWGKRGITLSNGCKLFAKAFTSKIKGMQLNYVHVDEVQDITDREVYWKGIEPTVNHKVGTIVATGVPDRPGDMIEELSENPEYFHKRYPAMIKGKPLWPEKFSVEVLAKIRKRSGEASFQSQYMLNPKVSGDDAVYPHNWIYNCFDNKEKFESKQMYDNSIITLGADFAISDTPRADFDCYLIIEKIAGKNIIRHAERHKGLHPEAKKERLRQLHRQFNPVVMNLDSSHVGNHIIKDLRSEGLPAIEGPFYSKERKQMLVNLQMLMQPDKEGKSALVIPRKQNDSCTMDFTNILIDELIGFRVERSEKTKIETYASRAKHDDTVAALILACKAAMDQQDFVGMVAIRR